MSALDWLAVAAEERRTLGLHRELRPRSPDASHIDLASNDYLGLSRNAEVIEAAMQACAEWGTGSTGSRLVTGTTNAHVHLEDELADFTGFTAALVFSSGYLANLGAVTALAGRGDVIISDAGSHASLVDACRLSRARVVVTRRADPTAIERALSERAEERALVVTDSVFSADGDCAPIAELYRLCRKHRAVLLVDEAHAIGVRGRGGRGLAEEVGLADAPDLVVTATLSKALGSQGGVVLGSPALRDHLIDRARAFIFDTGLNPAAVGAARTALAVLRRQPELAERVHMLAGRLASAIGAPKPSSAVVSYIVGAPEAAVAAADYALEHGVLVGCFRPPSVPDGTSRLRMTVRASISDTEIDQCATVISSALLSVGVAR